MKYHSGIIHSADLRKLAHCKLCSEPMLFVYSQALRDYCWECLEELAMENARRILGTK